MTNVNMQEKCEKIKMIVMDVDGVMTDGRIILGDNIELKCFHVQDGYAIKKLFECRIVPVIITGRTSKCVEIRARELNIVEVHQGVKNKLICLEEIMKKYKMNWGEVCYIGDDIPDLEIMKKVGFKVAVNNAVDDVKKIADYITTKDGGKGAVREAVDMILFSRLRRTA